jgi:nitroimidazol reductase NimA-like FMN-containing flavoprotein (pyridoxamine 5'-phosphate oxidase superfamily)
VDRNGLEVLDDAECRRLLSGSSFGRLAVTSGALPVILPVNFLLDGDRILVRTGSGTKLDAAMRDAVVAFEVDNTEPFSHAGWSVCVTGVAREVRDEAELRRISGLPLPHWAPNGVGHVMAISMDLLSGRRIPRP